MFALFILYPNDPPEIALFSTLEAARAAVRDVARELWTVWGSDKPFLDVEDVFDQCLVMAWLHEVTLDGGFQQHGSRPCPRRKSSRLK